MSPRVVSAGRMAEAVAATAAVPRVVVAGNFATPWEAVAALDATVPSWTLHMLNAQAGVPVRPGLALETCFVGPGMRDQPTLSYVPSRLSLVPRLLRGPLRPHAVVVHVAPRQGDAFSLGTEVNVLPAAIEAARASGGLVVAVVNPSMPYTYGDALLPVDDVDLVVETDRPLDSPAAAPEVSAEVAEIGDRVAARVADGSTFQVGIGAVPDEVLRRLTARRGLRVWSEMISDGVLGLERDGALDPDVPITATFLFGSPDLYAWADRNPRLHMAATQVANDPARICTQPGMVSVNTALEVDLYDQANASYRRGRVFSGLGGQADFVVGALHATRGQAIIALRSWHPRADRSTIVPRLDQPVTSFQHSAVVTEHGTAELVGRSHDEQRRNLVEHAAHPQARDALRSAMGERLDVASTPPVSA